MAEPVGPTMPGASAPSNGDLVARVRAAPVVDRLTIGVSAVVLLAAFLPWNSAQLLTGGSIGLTSGIFALLAIVAGVAAGGVVLGRLTGALDLGPNATTISTALGGGCLGFTVIHFLTNTWLPTTGLFLTLLCGAFLLYLGIARGRGDALQRFESPRRGSRSRGPITTQRIVGLLTSALGIGPIIGSIVAGGAFFPISHSMFTVLATSVGMMVVLTLLRMADGVLRPVWVLVGGIPPVLRFPAGLIVPLYISITRASPDSAGIEIESTRTAMFLSVVAVYILFHGPPKDQQAPATGPAPAPGASFAAGGQPPVPPAGPPAGPPSGPPPGSPHG